MQCPYQRLRTFIDCQVDRKLVLHSPVIVDLICRDIDLGKAIGAVHIFQAADIAAEQRLAKASMRQQASRRLNLHTCSKQVVAEIPVTRNVDPHQFVRGTRINHICDPQQVRVRRFLLDSNFRFEVPACLQKVQQVAPSFIEQVVVQRVLLINWNILLDHAPA